MPAPNGLFLITVFALTALALGVGFVALVLLNQRRLMEAKAAELASEQALYAAATVGRVVPWSERPDGLFSLGPLGRELLKHEGPITFETLVAEVPPLEAAGLVQGLQDLVEGQEGRWETSLGSHRAEWHARRTAGRLQGVLRDITHQALLQAQLIQSQKLEALGMLSSGLSHEFGNLLMTVESCAGVLTRDGTLGDASREAAQLIAETATRGRKFVRRLSTLARATPSFPVAIEPYAFLQDMATFLRPVLPSRIHLNVDASQELPSFYADRDKLHQATLNLALNARDAMPQNGKLTLRASAGPRPGHHDGRVWILLEVADTGCGMSPEVAARILEPFFSTKPPGEGTGLGLPITAAILEEHGGALDFTTRPGEGTVMQLWLPATHGSRTCSIAPSPSVSPSPVS